MLLTLAGHAEGVTIAAVTAVQINQERVFPGGIIVSRQQDGHLRPQVLFDVQSVERRWHVGERDSKCAAGRQFGGERSASNTHYEY